ncbi:MAG: sigma-70 family RNA polymerase sigma factor [Planctomycetia bacterium]|nr:sigma-70 family RNA polymerase sigma factor [Planctomycetia bacterium]
MAAKDISTWSDKEIIDALRTGDNDAWEYVFVNYVVPATKYPSNRYRLSISSIPIEDVFGGVWKKLSRINPKTHEDLLTRFERKNDNESLKLWFYKQVARVISNMVQKKCAKKKNFERQDPGNYIDEKEDENTVLKNIENKETRETIEKCFNDLWQISPIKAYAFLFFTQTHFTHEEIARILKVSETNARQIYHRAKEQMRALMEPKTI